MPELARDATVEFLFPAAVKSVSQLGWEQPVNRRRYAAHRMGPGPEGTMRGQTLCGDDDR